MRSTARRRGVYGGEYAPTVLHMFAWWKKNGKKRLQKPSSGFAQIRSNQTPAHRSLYIDTRARSNIVGAIVACSARHAAMTIGSTGFVTIWSNSNACVLFGTCGLASGLWARSPPSMHKGQAPALAQQRACQVPRRSTRSSEPGRWPLRSIGRLFFLLFFLLFISSK
jgi:hypothetical protein